MKMILLLSIPLFTAINCSSEKNPPPPSFKNNQPIFQQPWNSTFHLRENENGEVLSIGAVYSDEKNTFVYDLAMGTVVILDSTLSPASTVQLATIGRNSYAGDDFVVTDSLFIFLNGVDRRLELFDRFNGRHLRAVPLPPDLMSGAAKRSYRTLNRIFLDGNTLMIGNEHYLTAFDCKLGKRAAAAAAVSAGDNERVLLFKQKGSVILHDSLLKNRTSGLKVVPPGTHFPIAGKRFFTRGSALYAVEAGKDSIRIAEVK
jgi:hypothetical protein